MKKYIPIWSYLPLDHVKIPADMSGITQSLKFKNNVEGDRIRFLLNNRFGENPLRMSSLTLKVNGEEYPVSLNGKSEIVILSGEVAYSDEIVVDLKLEDELLIETTFPEDMIAETLSTLYNDSYTKLSYTHKGERVDMKSRSHSMLEKDCQIVVGISQVEVYTDKDVKVIAAFGDSLTHFSNWTSHLQTELLKHFPNTSLINAGQGGNRLTYDAYGNNEEFLRRLTGDAGIKRFENDVYGKATPDIVIVAIGINDLIHPGSTAPLSQMVTSNDLIEAYKVLHEEAKKHESKVVISTITSFKGFRDDTVPEESELIRQEVNEWIRHQDLYDMVIDMDLVSRDPNDYSRLSKFFEGDDCLHFPSEAGLEIVNGIDIEDLLR